MGYRVFQRATRRQSKWHLAGNCKTNAVPLSYATHLKDSVHLDFEIMLRPGPFSDGPACVNVIVAKNVFFNKLIHTLYDLFGEFIAFEVPTEEAGGGGVDAANLEENTRRTDSHAVTHRPHATPTPSPTPRRKFSRSALPHTRADETGQTATPSPTDSPTPTPRHATHAASSPEVPASHARADETDRQPPVTHRSPAHAHATPTPASSPEVPASQRADETGQTPRSHPDPPRPRPRPRQVLRLPHTRRRDQTSTAHAHAHPRRKFSRKCLPHTPEQTATPSPTDSPHAHAHAHAHATPASSPGKADDMTRQRDSQEKK
nr:putative uncharacterized protein DDB_G0290521 [Penaeus vannamei]